MTTPPTQPHHADPMPDDYGGNGVHAILAERGRQIFEKGWTAEHDDTHVDGSLAECAGLIALADHDLIVDDEEWPDQVSQHVLNKYRGDRIRQLAIAGALIAAEIDRLNRAKPVKEQSNT